MSDEQHKQFEIKDCALAAIGTGLRAHDLREFRDILASVHAGCLYHHFWGGLLRPQFENPQFVNDFAEWANGGLHDKPLAERLGVIDPAEYSDLEELRREVLEIIEQRLDELETNLPASRSRLFHFIRSQIIVFDTGRRLSEPSQLADAIPQMSEGSIYYHYIDARRRNESGSDDFRVWLSASGGASLQLADRLAAISPYFISLHALRDQLTITFRDYFKGTGK